MMTEEEQENLWSEGFEAARCGNAVLPENPEHAVYWLEGYKFGLIDLGFYQYCDEYIEVVPLGITVN